MVPCSTALPHGAAVDAAGEPRGDDVAGAADAGGEHAGELLAGRRAVAGADDGHDRACQKGEVALDVEQRRRRIDGGKRGG